MCSTPSPPRRSKTSRSRSTKRSKRPRRPPSDMTSRYALGIDYGTNSCRSLLVDLHDGREVGSTVFNYPSGELGILTDPRDPNVARQNPQDYLDGLEAVVRGALEQARANVPGFDAAQVVGIGVDTTGS